MNKVIFHKRVIKVLRKLPIHIVKNLQVWGELVEEMGIEEVRRNVRPGSIFSFDQSKGN